PTPNPSPQGGGEPRRLGVNATKIRSRDASAPELCQRQSQNRPAEQDRVTPNPAVEPAFGSIMLQQSKESGTPTGALVHPPRPYLILPRLRGRVGRGRGSRSAERARLSAFHH